MAELMHGEADDQADQPDADHQDKRRRVLPQQVEALEDHVAALSRPVRPPRRDAGCARGMAIRSALIAAKPSLRRGRWPRRRWQRPRPGRRASNSLALGLRANPNYQILVGAPGGVGSLTQVGQRPRPGHGRTCPAPGSPAACRQGCATYGRQRRRGCAPRGSSRGWPGRWRPPARWRRGIRVKSAPASRQRAMPSGSSGAPPAPQMRSPISGRRVGCDTGSKYTPPRRRPPPLRPARPRCRPSSGR